MNLKNTIFFLLVLSNCTVLNGQTLTHINYQEDNANFTNPERGFYHAVSHIDYNDLMSFRKEGISLIFKTYHLGQFKNGLISTSFLRDMEEDFKILRKAGMKAVIRFSYTDKSTPPYGDARPEIVLKHVSQLKPILQANSDVILVLQAGFIGAWGEWYYTDYYSVSPGNISAKNWADRRQLVDSLLAAIPPNRMVQVRTPQYKIKLLNMQSYIPVKPSQAYTDLSIARIAHHNDCFVSSPSDVGTYVDSTIEKPYLAKDSKYTIVGGETCQKCAQSTCSNSLKELRRFHWTFLNKDYNQSIIGEWQGQGCLPDIQRKLGYRFRLLTSNIQDSSKPGGIFNLNIKMVNDGWANPTNPRPVEVILKNKTTGKTYYVNPDGDIRFWPIDDTINIDITAGIPGNFRTGKYDVFLNFPDADNRLSEKPEYSIRLANANVWNSIWGYNSLNHVINIDTSVKVPAYYGGKYFKEKNGIQPTASVKIIINGNTNDWLTVPVAYSVKNQKANLLKIFNTKDTLFILVQGNGIYPHSQFLFDADNDSTTGIFYGPWCHTGFEYLIENNKLFRYTGTNHEWGWKYIADINLSQNDSVIELKVPFSQFDKPSIANCFRIGFINNFDGDTDKSYFPIPSENMISIRKNDLSQKPVAPVVKNFGTYNLIYWTRNIQNPDVYTILQRAEDGKNFTNINTFKNTKIAYSDDNLQKNHSYQYRIQYKEGNKLSIFSDTIEKTTSQTSSHFAEIKLDGQADDWNICPPSATGIVHGKIASICFYNNQGSLYFGLRGIMEHSYQLYFNIGGIGNFDQLISNDSLFIYSSGKWVFTKLLTSYHSSNFMETGLKMSELGLDTANMFSAKLFIDGIDVWGNGQTFSFMKHQTLPQPKYFKLQTLTDYTYSRIKLSWYPDESPDGYIIERSKDDSLHFEQIANLDNTKFQYIDRNLDSTATYYYRMFAYKDILRSANTPIQWMKPGVTGVNNIIDGSAKVYVAPNPVRFKANIHIFLRYSDKITVSLISINGRKVAVFYDGYVIGEENIPFQKRTLQPGVYILRIIGFKTHIYKKIIIY